MRPRPHLHGQQSAAADLIRLLAAFAIALALRGVETLMAADPPEPSEAQVKAVFLINFSRYVEWPPQAFAQSNSPIVIAVFGESELDGDLQKMTERMSVHGRPLAFKRVTTEQECAEGCHILFIGTAMRRRLPAIFEKLRGISVLTVGDSDDFLDQGGMIHLARRDRKIRLRVNLPAAKKAHVTISSKLLSVADVIKGRGN